MDAKRLASVVAFLQEEKTELASSVEAFRLENDRLLQDHGKLATDRDAATRELQALKTRYATLAKVRADETAELRAQIATLKEQNQGLTAKVAALTSDLQEASKYEQACKSLAAELAKAKQDMHVITLDRDAARRMVAELTDAVDTTLLRAGEREAQLTTDARGLQMTAALHSLSRFADRAYLRALQHGFSAWRSAAVAASRRELLSAAAELAAGEVSVAASSAVGREHGAALIKDIQALVTAPTGASPLELLAAAPQEDEEVETEARPRTAYPALLSSLTAARVVRTLKAEVALLQQSLAGEQTKRLAAEEELAAAQAAAQESALLAAAARAEAEASAAAAAEDAARAQAADDVLRRLSSSAAEGLESALLVDLARDGDTYASSSSNTNSSGEASEAIGKLVVAVSALRRAHQRCEALRLDLTAAQGQATLAIEESESWQRAAAAAEATEAKLSAALGVETERRLLLQSVLKRLRRLRPEDVETAVVTTAQDAYLASTVAGGAALSTAKQGSSVSSAVKAARALLLELSVDDLHHTPAGWGGCWAVPSAAPAGETSASAFGVTTRHGTAPGSVLASSTATAAESSDPVLAASLQRVAAAVVASGPSTVSAPTGPASTGPFSVHAALTRTIELLQARLAAASADLSEADAREAKLRVDRQRLARDAEGYRSAVAQTEAKVAALRDSLANEQMSAVLLSAQAEARGELTRALQERVAVLESDAARLAREAEAARVQAQLARHAEAASERKAATAASAATAAEETVRHLEGSIYVLHGEVGSANARVAATNRALEQARAAKAAVDAELASVVARLGEVEAQLATVSAVRDDLATSSQVLQARLEAETEARAAEAEAAASAAAAAAAAHAAEVQSLLESMRDAAATHATEKLMMADRAAAEVEAARAHGAAALEAAENEWRCKLDDTVRRRDEEAEALKRRVDTLVTNLDRARGLIHQMEGVISSQTTSLAIAQESLLARDKELARLQDDLAASDAEKASLVDRLRATLAALDEERSATSPAASASATAAQVALAVAEDRIQALQERLTAKDTQLASLQAVLAANGGSAALSKAAAATVSPQKAAPAAPAPAPAAALDLSGGEMVSLPAAVSTALASEVLSLRVKVAKDASTISSLQDALEAARADLEGAKQTVSRLGHEAAAAQSLALDTRADLDDCRRALVDLTAGLTAAQTQAAASSRRLLAVASIIAPKLMQTLEGFAAGAAKELLQGVSAQLLPGDEASQAGAVPLPGTAGSRVMPALWSITLPAVEVYEAVRLLLPVVMTPKTRVPPSSTRGRGGGETGTGRRGSMDPFSAAAAAAKEGGKPKQLAQYQPPCLGTVVEWAEDESAGTAGGEGEAAAAATTDGGSDALQPITEGSAEAPASPASGSEGSLVSLLNETVTSVLSSPPPKRSTSSTATEPTAPPTSSKQPHPMALRILAGSPVGFAAGGSKTAASKLTSPSRGGPNGADLDFQLFREYLSHLLVVVGSWAGRAAGRRAVVVREAVEVALPVARDAATETDPLPEPAPLIVATAEEVVATPAPARPPPAAVARRRASGTTGEGSGAATGYAATRGGNGSRRGSMETGARPPAYAATAASSSRRASSTPGPAQPAADDAGSAEGTIETVSTPAPAPTPSNEPTSYMTVLALLDREERLRTAVKERVLDLLERLCSKAGGVLGEVPEAAEGSGEDEDNAPKHRYTETEELCMGELSVLLSAAETELGARGEEVEVALREAAASKAESIRVMAECVRLTEETVARVDEVNGLHARLRALEDMLAGRDAQIAGLLLGVQTAAAAATAGSAAAPAPAPASPSKATTTTDANTSKRPSPSKLIKAAAAAETASEVAAAEEEAQIDPAFASRLFSLLLPRKAVVDAAAPAVATQLIGEASGVLPPRSQGVTTSPTPDYAPHVAAEAAFEAGRHHHVAPGGGDDEQTAEVDAAEAARAAGLASLAAFGAPSSLIESVVEEEDPDAWTVPGDGVVSQGEKEAEPVEAPVQEDGPRFSPGKSLIASLLLQAGGGGGGVDSAVTASGGAMALSLALRNAAPPPPPEPEGGPGFDTPAASTAGGARAAPAVVPARRRMSVGSKRALLASVETSPPRRDRERQ